MLGRYYRFFTNTAAMGCQFASMAVQRPFVFKPYVIGIQLTPVFMVLRRQEVRQQRITLLGETDSHVNLKPLIKTLFDYGKTARLLQDIDKIAGRLIRKNYPALFVEYQTTREADLPTWLQTVFLPALHQILSDLATHYGYAATDVVRLHDVLLDDTFMDDYISQGKLPIDLGEDGHGPLPHVITAFLLARLQSRGEIASAKAVYRALATRSEYGYCSERDYFRHRFSLLLDAYSENAMFANPANLSNHLLQHCEHLGKLAAVCKSHAPVLLAHSRETYRQPGMMR